jgi:hypothetical protein
VVTSKKGEKKELGREIGLRSMLFEAKDRKRHLFR